eukprot:scaffold33186_cov72-Phaeocystis_antarctica.AAC.1
MFKWGVEWYVVKFSCKGNMICSSPRAGVVTMPPRATAATAFSNTRPPNRIPDLTVPIWQLTHLCSATALSVLTSSGVGPPAAWTTARDATLPRGYQVFKWARTRQLGPRLGASSQRGGGVWWSPRRNTLRCSCSDRPWGPWGAPPRRRPPGNRPASGKGTAASAGPARSRPPRQRLQTWPARPR